MRSGLVSIKGPLTTPVGGGIRSLNVALRQKLDLFACVRPVRWYEGTPSPVKAPGDVDMVIFRENSEDVYAASSGKQEAKVWRNSSPSCRTKWAWTRSASQHERNRHQAHFERGDGPNRPCRPAIRHRQRP